MKKIHYYSKLFTSLLRQEIGYFDDPLNSSASLTTGLARSTSTLAQVYGVGLGSQIASITSLITALALGFSASWRLALAILGVIPVMVAGIASVFVLIMGGGDGDNGAHNETGAVASEAL